MSSFWVEQSRLQKRALPEIRIRPSDVFIVSYPKSGNTWVRFLLANLLAPEAQISFRNIENYVPNIYKSCATLEERQGRRYIKSHHPCYELYPKTVYVYRDGRDALVSYYHYAIGKKVFRGSFGDFVFSPFVEQFSSWKEHVTGALDFASNGRSISARKFTTDICRKTARRCCVWGINFKMKFRCRSFSHLAIEAICI